MLAWPRVCQLRNRAGYDPGRSGDRGLPSNAQHVARPSHFRLNGKRNNNKETAKQWTTRAHACCYYNRLMDKVGTRVFMLDACNVAGAAYGTK